MSVEKFRVCSIAVVLYLDVLYILSHGAPCSGEYTILQINNCRSKNENIYPRMWKIHHATFPSTTNIRLKTHLQHTDNFWKYCDKRRNCSMSPFTTMCSYFTEWIYLRLQGFPVVVTWCFTDLLYVYIVYNGNSEWTSLTTKVSVITLTKLPSWEIFSELLTYFFEKTNSIPKLTVERTSRAF